eukprot:747236-Hanusia_phi.AAC.1
MGKKRFVDWTNLKVLLTAYGNKGNKISLSSPTAMLRLHQQVEERRPCQCKGSLRVSETIASIRRRRIQSESPGGGLLSLVHFLTRSE